jgi:hypothetical protein
VVLAGVGPLARLEGLVIGRWLSTLVHGLFDGVADPGLSKPAPRVDAPLTRETDLSKIARVRYTTPRTYDEAAAIRSARRARTRTETGRQIPKPKRPPVATVTPIRRRA